MPSRIRLYPQDVSSPTAAPAGTLDIAADETGPEPGWIDDAGVFHTFVGAPGADAPAATGFDAGSSGAAYEFDIADGDVQELLLDDDAAITFTGWPSIPAAGFLQCWFTQDTGGPYVPTFGAEVEWGDAGEPDWSTTVGATDIINFETLDAGTRILATVAGRPGAPGTPGADGADGISGGAVSIPYTFSTTTTDSDPGSGNLRLSNATQNAATVVRADLVSSDGTTWTSVLDTLADASNTVKGHLRLYKTSDPTKWLLYTVSAVATPSGYRNITVANVGSSASSPLSNGDAITLSFSRSGDQGSTVGAGTLTTIEEVDGSPTDSAVTKLVFPNGTLGIASHVATYTPIEAGRLLAVNQYGASVDYDTTSATFADVDATNMAVTFTAPASGNVIVRLTACATIAAGTSNFLFWGLREGTTNLAGGGCAVRQPASLQSTSMAIYLTGISAGSHTYKWSFAASSGTGRIGVGPAAGPNSDNTPAVMEVWAAP